MQNSDQKYQNKIADFLKKHRRMPSFSELAELVGFKSKNAAGRLVKRLSEKGFIAKDQNGKIVPVRLHGEFRILGLVEAGFPSAAEEELVDTMSLDEYLIRNKEATFILRVKGDSMIDAGIMEGDMVLVERGKTPKPGEIVIAQVDGGYTMKYYRKKGDQIYLEAANKKYKPIYPENEMRIEAVVQAVIRRY